MKPYHVGMSDPAFQRMSLEEYLRTEPDSPVKREYVGGFVYVVDVYVVDNSG